ncbi:entericidin [Nitratireductor sp. ZSWI3]|uniref:entericidin domain-containing protein n=1 Tax=Nitratireductor sp. ZSWI3 TaxID=2966359 RepID=UPI00214FAF4D|nr:entericidin [Nitratireductor sp. ZSWI3]MCR4267815.1 entericidin [Nitratireductor sp. ZSWI3]
MQLSILSRIVVVVLVGAFAAGCANTIRGVGRDTANAVDATKRAGSDISRAAE